jgi:hypothetical protein
MLGSTKRHVNKQNDSLVQLLLKALTGKMGTGTADGSQPRSFRTSREAMIVFSSARPPLLRGIVMDLSALGHKLGLKK